jgi:hypothetical protein
MYVIVMPEPVPIWMQPAFWSAIAAFCSFGAAVMVVLIQRRNLIESVRPELVLTGLDRSIEGKNQSTRELLHFKGIKNVGRGVAMQAIVTCDNVNAEGKSLASGGSGLIPVVAVNEEVEADCEFSVWWNNVTDSHKFMVVKIVILYWDVAGMRYETTYHVAIEGPLDLQQKSPEFAARLLQQEIISPREAARLAKDTCIHSIQRRTVQRAIWSLKLENRIKELLNRKKK